MTNRIDSNHQSGCIDFEAAALGLDPKVLEKGRDYIKELISIRIAKPVYEINSSQTIINVDEQRFPGETNTTFKKEITNPKRFVGCLLPDRDSKSVIVIDSTNLNIGIFKFSYYDYPPFKTTESDFFEPNISVSVEKLQGDLISYFNCHYQFDTVATSGENTDIIIKTIDELVQKIKQKKELNQQNINTVAKDFVTRMKNIFND